jgi:glycerophosphoryl diester phosphodiesterase
LEIVAHRAGNTLASLIEAQQQVDLVEVDVHLDRRQRIEVRHAKRLWPTRRLWDRWYLLEKHTEVPSLAAIVDAADPDTHLWLDLKGPNPQLGRLAMAVVGDRRPITVSSKAWWLLGRFDGVAGVRTLRSAGNRFELLLLLRLPTRSQVDGAVVHRRLLDDQTIGRLSARGLLFTWGIEDVETVEWLRRRRIDGVILDDLALASPRP